MEGSDCLLDDSSSLGVLRKSPVDIMPGMLGGGGG